MACLPLSGRVSMVATIAAISTSILMIDSSVAAAGDTATQRVTDVTAAFHPQSLDRIIAEASARFAVPERWIRAVMQAESAGDPSAVSEAGAMGLMQIMPETWDELRTAHGLGDDPFDPRDNVLAGAAYLRAMYNQFGSPGFLAAYNAGQGRYAEHLATGRPLPRETRDYLAVLTPLVGASPVSPMQTERNGSAPDWQTAPLFVARIAPPTSAIDRPPHDRLQAVRPSANGLFVDRFAGRTER